MKILHIIHRFYPFRGGSENYFFEISRRFARDGDDVTVYTTDAWDLEHLWKPGHARIEETGETVEGICVHRFPVQNAVFGKRILRAAARTVPTLGSKCYFSRTSPLIPDLWREGRKGACDFDVVHSCPFPMEVLHYVGHAIARRGGAAHVITPCLHPGEGEGDLIDGYSKPHQVRLLEEADHVLALTGLERDLITGMGVSGGKITVLGHAVEPTDLEGGDGPALREKLGVNSDAFIVGHIAGLSVAKGSVDICRAVLKLAREGLDIHAVLAGPELSEFGEYFEKLDDASRARIHNLGYVSDIERNSVLDAMNVFAMPSKTDSFGLVFLESWFYEKPVLACPLGGPKEIVHHEEDGLHVPYGNVEELAAAMKKLADEPELCKEFGKAGRKRADDSGFYSWEEIYQKLRSVYESLHEKKKTAAE